MANCQLGRVERINGQDQIRCVATGKTDDTRIWCEWVEQDLHHAGVNSDRAKQMWKKT